MPRRPLKSDDELLALAQRLEAEYGMVTVPALRAAAGGGSPNRLRSIIDAMLGQQHSGGPAEPIIEVAPQEPEQRMAGRETGPRSSKDIQIARYAARLEELQRSQDRILDLLRDERRTRQSELDVLSHLIERQNDLVDQLGRLVELALKATRSDLMEMRREFNQVLDRMGGASRRDGTTAKGTPGDGFSFQ